MNHTQTPNSGGDDSSLAPPELGAGGGSPDAFVPDRSKKRAFFQLPSILVSIYEQMY